MPELDTPLTEKNIQEIARTGECNYLRFELSTRISNMKELIDLLPSFPSPPYTQQKDLIYSLQRIADNITLILKHLSARWPE
jgi:division protein CdvB (Snf7/Vps24/ESCRT-III family)